MGGEGRTRGRGRKEREGRKMGGGDCPGWSLNQETHVLGGGDCLDIYKHACTVRQFTAVVDEIKTTNKILTPTYATDRISTCTHTHIHTVITQQCLIYNPQGYFPPSFQSMPHSQQTENTPGRVI